MHICQFLRVENSKSVLLLHISILFNLKPLVKSDNIHDFTEISIFSLFKVEFAQANFKFLTLSHNSHISHTTISYCFSTLHDYLHILIIATHSKKEISIDLFNLPPLPDERNALDAYMDVPNNFYITDGKNTRLMDCIERREVLEEDHR